MNFMRKDKFLSLKFVSSKLTDDRRQQGMTNSKCFKSTLSCPVQKIGCDVIIKNIDLILDMQINTFLV